MAIEVHLQTGEDTWAFRYGQYPGEYGTCDVAALGYGNFNIVAGRYWPIVDFHIIVARIILRLISALIISFHYFAGSSQGMF